MPRPHASPPLACRPAALALLLAGVATARGPTSAAGAAPAGAIAPTPAIDGAPAPPPPPPPGEDDAGPLLADAPAGEQRVLDAFARADDWPRRAIAALRLERYACPPARSRLVGLLADPEPPVRVFAAHVLARRGDTGPLLELVRAPDAGAPVDPLLLRTLLRHGLDVPTDRVRAAMDALDREPTASRRLLAVELGAASGDPGLADRARETLGAIIRRMDRAAAGTLAPRIARLTGEHDRWTPMTWQRWWMAEGGLPLEDAHFRRPLPPRSLVADLAPVAFAGLEDYLDDLGAREVDLAILLDCTASMGGELRRSQSGVDDLVAFTTAVVRDLRVAVVGYRDRRDRDFEVRWWDFTTDPVELRERLWSLWASGGGDGPELVHEAMLAAGTELSWRAAERDARSMVMVIVGDAPPRPGWAGRCVEWAAAGRERGLVVHAIESKGRPVDHFDDIARASGGRCVSLDRGDLLVAEIAGLSIGEAYAETFADMFDLWVALCR